MSRAAALLGVTLCMALCLAGPAPAQDPAAWPERSLPERGFDVRHYRIEIDLDDATRSFRASTRVDLEVTRAGLASVVLDAESFAVDGVRLSSESLGFAHDAGRLVIALPGPAQAGAALSLRVDYHADAVDVDAERFGMSADYDLGLDFKAAGPRHPALVNTLSFPEGARHWFPCLDHPSDRATQELVTTLRADWRVLSNGRLVSDELDAASGRRRVHWSLEQSHPTYLAVLVAGPYRVLEDAHGALPVHYWVYPGDVEDAPRSFARTPEILGFLEALYGRAFPWVKYDQVAIPGIGGGAESTTATVLSESTLHTARGHADYPSEWLVAHEAAHQWWGDLVSYRDWGETWLSESFATWSEYRWALHDLGPAEGGLNLDEKRRAYLEEARSRYRRPMQSRRWRVPNDNFDRHTYQRGALVIEMLGELLGEPRLRAALALFLERHAFQSVATEDLVVAIWDATGEDVGWFVEQWVRRPGHPELELAREWDAGAGELVLRARQLQARDDGTPVYRLPLRFAFGADSGARQEHELWLEGESEEWRVPLAARPTWVRFDPRDRLLAEYRFEQRPEEWQAQLAGDDASGRRQAALALAAHTDSPGVRASLRRAASDDPFRGVRAAAVEALGTPRDAAQLAWLSERARRDPHSAVRAAALSALAGADPPPLELLLERARAEPSDRARAEAVRAAAQAGAPRAFLEEAAGWPSARDVVGRAARAALGIR